MGYRFQSEYLYDKKLNREMIRGVGDANRLTLVMNLILIGLLVYIFAVSVLIFDFGDVFGQYMLLLGGLYALIALVKWLSRLGGGVAYKRVKAMNGGEIPTNTVQFWDSYVLCLNARGNDRSQLSYDQFRGIIETKNLYLLTMKHNMFLMVDKRTLTGDPESFQEFLFFKCDNIRRKKVRSILPGKVVRILARFTIIALVLAAVLLHPRLDLPHRMAGQIHNGMSGSQIVEELEKVGISGLDSLEADTSAEFWSMDFITDNSKLEDVMYYPTMGTWDDEQELMVPGPINYGFSYYWADEEALMYTHLLRKLDAMCADIFIGEIRENQLLTDGDFVTGEVAVSFELNGTVHTIDAVYDYDIYDPDVFGALSAILEAETGKQLWFRDYQEFGTWLFLGDAAWAQAFEEVTGWTLSDDYREACPDYYSYD